jgi:predicted RNase H-like nuclease (RuvC/YqgF family)
MDITELIISFSGTAIGGALIGKWLNKKKDSLEIKLKEQVFYKTLIEDIQKQRSVEQNEIGKLKKEIELLSEKIAELISDNKEKDYIISSQRNTVRRWEDNCDRLEVIIKQKDKQICKLFDEIEEHEKINGQIDTED